MRTSRLLLLLVAATALAGALGCRPARPRTQEYKFAACARPAPGTRPADLSYDALVGALTRSGFIFDRADREALHVRAALMGKIVLRWDLQVGAAGEVRFLPTAGLTAKEQRLEAKWVKKVERVFNERRCLPAPALREDAAAAVSPASPARKPAQDAAIPEPPDSREKARKAWDELEDDLER